MAQGISFSSQTVPAPAPTPRPKLVPRYDDQAFYTALEILLGVHEVDFGAAWPEFASMANPDPSRVWTKAEAKLASMRALQVRKKRIVASSKILNPQMGSESGAVLGFAPIQIDARPEFTAFPTQSAVLPCSVTNSIPERSALEPVSGAESVPEGVADSVSKRKPKPEPEPEPDWIMWQGVRVGLTPDPPKPKVLRYVYSKPVPRPPPTPALVKDRLWRGHEARPIHKPGAAAGQVPFPLAIRDH